MQVNQMTSCFLTESTALRLQKESNVHTLDLSKFTVITPSAAKVVTSFNCHLILDGLNSMDEVTARVLCNHPGNLQLNGLSELSESLIKIMVQHKGRRITLNGIRHLCGAALFRPIQRHIKLCLPDGLGFVRSPTKSWKPTPVSSLTRPKTACMRRRGDR